MLRSSAISITRQIFQTFSFNIRIYSPESSNIQYYRPVGELFQFKRKNAMEYLFCYITSHQTKPQFGER